MDDARFLLDTNILIYIAAGASPELRDRVEECAPGSIVTSTLCVAEALFGIGEDDALEEVLGLFEAVPFDLAAARLFPTIPFRRGRLDRLIAAQALSRGMTIVTNNERDFADVPDLRIENWTI
ncbi:MAG TPA: type II toxin-antitoxin system VapC family toxin [Sphingomonas sp.]|nr:type II toxin-antitoxin system VapC family toxin [Sphingomonas sp.]